MRDQQKFFPAILIFIIPTIWSELNIRESRTWLLPLMRDHIQRAPLADFKNLFLPLIQTLEKRRNYNFCFRLSKILIIITYQDEPTEKRRK